MPPAVGIILFCVGAAIVYGVVHDQITARVCVEYFTLGHPPVFQTNDPTLLGLGWGVFATWWVGLTLGVALAITARAGSRLPRTFASLVRPVAILLAVMGVCALVAGVTGWLLARNGVVVLVDPLRHEVPTDRHALFLADLWVHTASYSAGFLGGLVVIANVWRSRTRNG